jgi:hypothetical protein
MEVLLIDIGALAAFLAYVAIVYWHGISHDPDSARPAAGPASQLDCASARARSARSSVGIAQRWSQLLQ